MTIFPEVENQIRRAIEARQRPRRRRFGVTVGVTVLLAGSGTAIAASNWDALIGELKQQPTVDFRAPGPDHSARDVRSEGARIAATIPTPPGHPIDVNWEASGGDNEAGIRSVAEYNAACKWYAYALESEPSADTLRVVATIPDWPSFRGTFKADRARQISDDLAAGRTSSAEAEQTLNCGG